MPHAPAALYTESSPIQEPSVRVRYFFMPARRPADQRRVAANPHAHGAESPAAGSIPYSPPSAAQSAKSAQERAVLAAVLDPIVTINAQGIIQSATNSVQRVFGWMPSELAGRNVNMLMPEPYHSAHDGYLANYRRTGQTNIIGRAREFEAVRKNGERFPIELSVSRVDQDDGGMPLFVGIIRDISMHKRLEREAILLKDLALRVSNTSTIDQARVEALRLIGLATGWDYGEVWVPEGPHLVGVVHWVRPGSGLEGFAQTMAGIKLLMGSGLAGKAWETGRPCWYGNLAGMSEAEFCRPAAARAAGLQAAASIPIVADGKIIKLLMFFAKTTRAEDIHMLELARVAAAPLAMLIQKKHAEDAHRQSEEQLQAAFDLAAVGQCQFSPRTGRFQRVNAKLCEITGYAQDELLSMSFHDLAAPDDRSGRRRAFDAAVWAKSGTYAVEQPAIRKSGEKIWIRATAAILGDPEDAAYRAIAMVENITKRKELEQQLEFHSAQLEKLVDQRTAQLKRTHEQLQIADRLASIGTLAAGLGHDMNNVLLPVRARLNALEAAGGNGKLPLPECKHVGEIKKSVAYLQQLADGLHFLALDPEEGEDARGGGATTDLKNWWSQAGPLLSKAVPKHVRVAASFPAGLTAAVASHGLTQAILNLVVNAGEAIPGPAERKRHQGLVRLSASSIRYGGATWVKIAVADNGAGMTDEVKRRAFELFFTTKPRGLGTGLGLALVRKVVERAGGTVEIQSELNKGTTVALLLPDANSFTASAEPPTAIISIASGRTAALVKHCLEAAGAQVRDSADPGKAAIWVVEPTSAALAEVKPWRASHPSARLVLFGPPTRQTAATWRALHPLTIDHPDDFEAVRRTIHQAVVFT